MAKPTDRFIVFAFLWMVWLSNSNLNLNLSICV